MLKCENSQKKSMKKDNPEGDEIADQSIKKINVKYIEFIKELNSCMKQKSFMGDYQYIEVNKIQNFSWKEKKKKNQMAIYEMFKNEFISYHVISLIFWIHILSLLIVFNFNYNNVNSISL